MNGSPRVDVEDLGILPKDYLNRVCISEDGLHIAAVIPNGAHETVWYDGKAGAVFDEVARVPDRNYPAIHFSRAGNRFAYFARRGSTRFLVLNDKEIPVQPPDGSSGGTLVSAETTARFTPDGKHFIYTTIGDDTRQHVVRDEETDPGFETVEPPVLSEQGDHYAYVAHTDDRRTVVVVDGKPGAPSLDEISRLQLSRDGQHCAFLSVAGDKARVVTDGKPGPDYESIDKESIQLGSNGRPCYRASKQDIGRTATVTVVDGNELHDQGDVEQLQFSKDGNHVAMVTTTPDGQATVVDGRAGKAYESIQNLQFSPDGSRTAYIGHNQSDEFAVIDEKEIGPFKTVSKITFSENGKCYAFVASSEQGVVVVVDGKRSRPYREFESLAISPNGSRYAYEGDVSIYEPELVIDGNASRAENLVATLEQSNGTDKVIFRFSPDSKRLAMASMVSGGAKYNVAVDGKAGPTSGWCARFVFSADSRHFAYVTRERMRDQSATAITVDNKIAYSLPVTRRTDEGLIAQMLVDARTSGIKQIDPSVFGFREDGRLRFLVSKDGKIFRVSIAPTESVSSITIDHGCDLASGSRQQDLKSLVLFSYGRAFRRP